MNDMTLEVAIIDYACGNIASVRNALLALGANVTITSDISVLKSADSLVLPGVGAFGQGMTKLAERSLVDPLRELVQQDKKPILGICLGMQMLASRGFEHGEHQGLGLIEGDVVKLTKTSEAINLPHVGWNEVIPEGSNVLLGDNNTSNKSFYFVHSYHLIPERKTDIAGTCNHGQPFCAAIARENIFGTQFHPEKSQKEGLNLLGNFLKYSAAQAGKINA
ncbi:MAG: imidazole glycerol phosphate synthase subunit HisH [Cyanobacteria bacterium REEB67]|nr:imidazole glycerol phosphate synthase subunit HisH [Cyanobacteria bacterium REEB67]